LPRRYILLRPSTCRRGHAPWRRAGAPWSPAWRSPIGFVLLHRSPGTSTAQRRRSASRWQSAGPGLQTGSSSVPTCAEYWMNQHCCAMPAKVSRRAELASGSRMGRPWAPRPSADLSASMTSHRSIDQDRSGATPQPCLQFEQGLGTPSSRSCGRSLIGPAPSSGSPSEDARRSLAGTRLLRGVGMFSCEAPLPGSAHFRCGWLQSGR